MRLKVSEEKYLLRAQVLLAVSGIFMMITMFLIWFGQDRMTLFCVFYMGLVPMIVAMFFTLYHANVCNCQ